jgi:probable rRNA maturation factor
MRTVAIANQHPRLRFDRRAIARVILTLDASHDQLATSASVLGNDGELSVAFFTDAALAKLHADFLDDPTATDVITFEGNPALGTAGEICVSADAAARQIASARSRPSAVRRGMDRTAFSRELTLYVVHGWLHLAGYDDLVPAKKRVMRRAEARAMALLERENAVPAFRLV